MPVWSGHLSDIALKLASQGNSHHSWETDPFFIPTLLSLTEASEAESRSRVQPARFRGSLARSVCVQGHEERHKNDLWSGENALEGKP